MRGLLFRVERRADPDVVLLTHLPSGETLAISSFTPAGVENALRTLNHIVARAAADAVTHPGKLLDL